MASPSGRAGGDLHLGAPTAKLSSTASRIRRRSIIRGDNLESKREAAQLAGGGKLSGMGRHKRDARGRRQSLAAEEMQDLFDDYQSKEARNTLLGHLK